MKVNGNLKTIFSFKIVIRFAIDFECGGSRNIALHLNPRLRERVFVRNSKKSGDWGEEDRDGPQLFAPGAEFKLQIECQEEGFKVNLYLIFLVCHLATTILLK